MSLGVHSSIVKAYLKYLLPLPGYRCQEFILPCYGMLDPISNQLKLNFQPEATFTPPPTSLPKYKFPCPATLTRKQFRLERKRSYSWVEVFVS